MASLRPAPVRVTLPRPVRIALAVGVGALLLLAWLGQARASADVVCPNPIPVVNENQCKTGTSAWQVSDYSPELGGFTTHTSVDLGESVVLKIGRNGPVSPTKTVSIAVFRMGYYDGLGGRLVNSASNVPINNNYTCESMDPTTGKVDCGNWSPTYTIPASSLPASGIYLAKLTASTGDETEVVFTVRDDERQPQSKVLYVLPSATYQAYNLFGGKSLYWGYEGESTVSGSSRAVKVSFNRPISQAGASQNWFLGPDFDLLFWMEKQGYDISYTDDVHVHQDPAELLNHDTVVISGHSEYWSLQQFNGFLAAREAGVNIASFSANTAYWKVRYENEGQTLVCYKTVEGSGSAGNGSVSQNDWGPDGIKGTADDALGADGVAGTADDNPQNATTTFRDNGAPQGDASAPPGGRVGPDKPENQLFGVMYVGDNDARGFPVTVPPGNANEEFASNRFWRNTGISENTTTDVGSFLVNWEWDAIPTQAQYLSREPTGVERLSYTNVQAASDNSWIQDEGRLRNTSPPPGQPGTVGAVKYTAASGAEVFASGTMEWSRGLSTEPDERIRQATYNVLSEMGTQPYTPEEEITLDPGGSNHAPNAGFTISQSPAKTSTPITFDASPSNDPDGVIAKYEWDLDGNGSYETSTGTKPSVTHSFPEEGEFQVRLRVTDNGGASDLAVRTMTIINNQPPTASFTATPSTIVKGEQVSFNASASHDPDGAIAKYEWDLDGNGSYETNGGASATIDHVYATPGSYTVGLRVTDNGGKTATTTRPIGVGTGEVSEYSKSVLATPGLVHYWRMGEAAGPTFADSAGSSTATAGGGTTFGLPGGVVNDPDRAAGFDGVSGSASAPMDLSATHAVTVEFWMNWSNWAGDDHLAMELTSNFNEAPGGFLVDPDAPQLGGTFGVAIGSGASRNNVFFERPSAGQWHHYAFVLDSSAPAAQQVIPYVDGKAVSYTKLDSGTGAGNFANSTLFMMSRAGSGLFGAGNLDEVAVYKRALSATTVSNHYQGIVVKEEAGEEEGGGSEEGTGGTGGGEGPTYTDTVQSTPGLLDYWRMDDVAGPTLADSVGSSPATATGGPTFSVPGGIPGDADTATRFDGVNDAASASLSLAGKTSLTVEFWMKWNSWSNDDALALEYTPDFNSAPGGFLVDPNSSYGAFAVALGIGPSRNISLFARPTAGQWHHYAFVLNTAAPASEEIVPYVDGQPVAYSKAQSGTGAGPFVNSTLSFMSRAGSGLFGAGDLDDLAIYGQGLSAATISQHFHANGNTNRPAAAFQAPPTAKVGEQIGFDASASKDPKGKIVKYEWDLDGNGSFEADTGTSPTVSHSYSTPGSVKVGLRVTDDSGNTAATTRTVVIEAGSSEEGGGGEQTSDYPGAVMGTPGLLDYWRMGEASGSVFADSAGSSPAAMAGGPTLGVAGAVPGNTAASFDGADDDASAALDLTGKTALTVEFWMKWSSWAGDDHLAMELTNNFNDAPGGFLVDPNSSYGGFAVALGIGSSRNVSLFARPTAGQWHHYAFVLDTAAPASEQIVPYVDGQPVAYTKPASGSGAPSFANAALSFMSRAGSTLFGAGALDEVAIYGRALSATTVANHYQGIVSNQHPVASFQAPATAKAGETVNFDAAASSDPDGTIAKYEWDLDGNGTYETDTGTSPTVSNVFSTPGSTSVGLRVTDNSGATAIVAHTIAVSGEETSSGGPTTYKEAVLGTPGLLDYWRMGESSGSVLADSVGPNSATTLGAPTLGVPGAIFGDPDPATRFDGIDDAASAPLTLSGATAVTVEFWMKWSSWANDDRLAFEYTPNFNESPGGFLVDPNSSYNGFAVALGIGPSRNLALFARPTAGQWHHYAFVLNTAAPASEEIVPYVDGHPVAFTKPESGSGAPAFANASLSFMSRAGSALFGAGDLDDVAIYNQALNASTIAAHYGVAAHNSPPAPSFTATPNPAPTGAMVNFDAGASSDPDGTIAKYEWDLDGNGTYETNTGTSPTTSRSYGTSGEKTIGLRTTDDGGATATTTRALQIQNRPPEASFTATPNPAPTASTLSLNAAASVDPDGTIAKYEWDLDGNGSYETNAGTSSSTTVSYPTAGDRSVGLRVTDNSGATGTTTRTVTIQNRPPEASFTAAPNPAISGAIVTFNAAASSDPDGTIAKYEWDLDGNGSYETSTGSTASTTRAYATPGSRAVGLRVTDDGGATATAVRTVVVENRAPTASFTALPNPTPTGTAISFNGSGSSDPDGTIAKYEWDLDGNGTYETNAGASATTTASYATPGSRVVGLRVTDDSGATATTTKAVTAQNRAPVASFTATPNPAPTGTTVNFDAAASSDPDGTIAKYEWDLDGNGTYETSTGTISKTARSYTMSGSRTIGLKITDDSGATATATQSVMIQNRPPEASFTASPNPVTAGSTVTYSAAASVDPDGTIVKYEWDLDGNGTYETNTGTISKATRSYSTAAQVNVGLRITDNSAATGTTTRTVTVRGPYNAAVSDTAGLIDYWRLGETTGTTFADSVGGQSATALNGVTLAAAGPLSLDSNTAASFDGTNDSATAALNLSSTQRLTIEFWLKWTTFANDDRLALEFTPNFNNTNGGFLVNPDSSTSGGRFEVALGRSGSRNNVYFTRPSAGVWHHYAFVLNTTASAAQQILAYVDGKAVTISKGSSGTGAGSFANSTLYVMSRGSASLFGRGTLDELGIYNQALTATQIAQHYAAK